MQTLVAVNFVCPCTPVITTSTSSTFPLWLITLAKSNFMKTLHMVRDLLPRNVMIFFYARKQVLLSARRSSHPIRPINSIFLKSVIYSSIFWVTVFVNHILCQNAPIHFMFPQKNLKNFWGGAQPHPQTPLLMGRGHLFYSPTSHVPPTPRSRLQHHEFCVIMMSNTRYCTGIQV